MQSTGAVHSASLPQSMPASNTGGSKFNSKLISGLKKNGNGIVVKVPAGVKGIKISSMRSPSATANMGKAGTVRVAFNNSAKDNFLTVRIDQNGKVHVSVLDDVASEHELGSKMRRAGSDVGIINGRDSRLNEKAGLRIREAINGKLFGGQVRFLSAAQLTNVSSRLQGLFEKFRSMRDKAATSRMGVIKEFRPKVNRRKEEGRRQNQGRQQGKDKQNKERQKNGVAEPNMDDVKKQQSQQLEHAATKLRQKLSKARKSFATSMPPE